MCFVAVAHAPATHHPARDHAEFRSHWQRMLAEEGKEEVLVQGMDANAQLGVAQTSSSAARGSAKRRWDCPDLSATGRLSSVLGTKGLPRTSRTGRVLLELCREHHLCAPMSFFQHRTYSTWTHPRWRSEHTLDHWFVRRQDLKRVLDARVSGAVALHSDHRALLLDLRVARNLRLKTSQRRPPQQFSTHLLRRPEVVRDCRAAALRAFSASSPADAGTPSSPSLCGPSGQTIPAPGRSDAAFEHAKAALLSAAEEVLTAPQMRPQPAWFTLREAEILRRIQARQSAESRWHQSSVCTVMSGFGINLQLHLKSLPFTSPHLSRYCPTTSSCVVFRRCCFGSTCVVFRRCCFGSNKLLLQGGLRSHLSGHSRWCGCQAGRQFSSRALQCVFSGLHRGARRPVDCCET